MHGEYVDHGIWFSFATCDKMLYMKLIFFLVILVWARWSNVFWGQKEFVGAKTVLKII
jgi:hypothetical protein